MQKFVDAGTAAGFVTLAAVKGKVVQLSAVGYQDLETKTPMRTDTIFEVMSLTKAVTAASILTLVDEGKISLVDPVEDYVPEFKGQLDATLPERQGACRSGAGFLRRGPSPESSRWSRRICSISGWRERMRTSSAPPAVSTPSRNVLISAK